MNRPGAAACHQLHSGGDARNRIKIKVRLRAIETTNRLSAVFQKVYFLKQQLTGAKAGDCAGFTRDILEWDIPEEVLAVLLKDRTTGKNLIWATEDNTTRGVGFGVYDEIRIEQVTDKNNPVIRPRVDKAAEEQRKRIEKRAEVFTPSWI